MKITRLLPALLCSTLIFSACTTESNRDDDNNPNTTNNNNNNANNKNNDDDSPPPLECADVNRSKKAPLLVATETAGEVKLSGTYRIDDTVSYNTDQKVTIAPGTVFLMEASSSLRFGWRDDPVKVTALGTAEKPILFCGTKKESGHWNHIEILTGTLPGSIFEHVRIEDAGRNDYALNVAADVDLKSVAIYGSASVGMALENLGKASKDITIKGSKLQPLTLTGSKAVTNLPEGDYTENGEDVALIHSANEQTTVFHNRGIPYRQIDERINYAGNPTAASVTFEAGVEYQFCAGCTMNIGWSGDPATIKSNGTADEPVVFTSASDTPTPGDWNGINLETGTLEGSLIVHTEFHYGGKADSANLVLDTDKNIPITNSKFHNSAGYGVWISEANTTFDASANTFEGNAQGDTNL